jgi:PAT family beta-lactamase induction signal transducer AmpG
MNVCDKEHAATQYALLSALFNLSGSLVGAFSGFGAERLGYGSWFALTFVLALPAYALLPAVRRSIREATSDPSESPPR